jgi:hypothetical protein
MVGTRLGRFVAATAIAIAATTASSAEAFVPRQPSDFFGVSAPNFHDMARKGQTGALDAYLTHIQATGVGWVRDAVIWPDAEPLPPVPSTGTHNYNWNRIDSQVARFAQHRVALQPVIRQAPGWAHPNLQGLNCRRDGMTDADHAADYGAFVAAIVRRYGQGGSFWAQNPQLPFEPITRVELWNEPNMYPFACPRPDPEAYARMVAAAGDAVDAVDRNVVVSVGGLVAQKATTPLKMETGEFLRRMTQEVPTLPDKVDAVAIHLYDLDPDGDISLIGWLRSKMAASGLGGESILVTEYGWHTRGGAGSVPEALRAELLTDFTNQAPRLNCDVIGIAPHAWVTAEQDPANPENWWGIADPATGAPYASGQAYADQVALFEGNGGAPAPRQTIPVCDRPLPDQDGDGTPDRSDDYPLDSTQSSGSGEPPGDPPPPSPPAKPPRVHSDFFAVMSGSYSQDVASRRAAADSMLDGQIGTSREIVDWGSIQPRPATDLGSDAQWADMDGRFLRLGLRGVRVLPTFSHVPAWIDESSPATADAAFADFLRAFARRYGRGGTFWRRNRHLDKSNLAVRDYEVWDRANLSQGWWSRSASGYANTYAQARAALHQVDPQAHALVSLDQAGASYAQFVRYMVAASPDLRGNIDGTFVLATTSRSEPAVERVVAGVRSDLDSTGNRRAPINLGFGWYVGGTGSMSDAERADFYRAVATRLPRSDCGVGGLLARSWATPQSQNRPSDWYGMVDPQTFQLGETARAYRDVARMYEGYGVDAPRAVVHTCFRQAPDTDRDGVADAAEDYPLDPAQATAEETPPPAPEISRAPTKLDNSGGADFDYSSPGATRYWCKLDGRPFENCKRSGRSFTGLGPGQHRFTVRALDSLGLVSPPTTFRWKIDKAPPDTRITWHPDRVMLVNSAKFGFSSNERGVRFACQVDSGRYQPCRSPFVLRKLPDGTHRFRVAAIDLAGNGDPTPSQFSFQVHTVPTAPTITTGPSAGAVSSPRPVFRFDARYAVRFQCRLDAGPFRQCSGTHSHVPSAPLSNGPHTFEVRGLGGTGKPGPATARSFRVDR